jgi:hypothetical protein
MASTTAPALIGIDPTFLAGNDRSAVPQFNAPIVVTGGVVSNTFTQAILPAVVGKTNYCTGVEVDYNAATGRHPSRVGVVQIKLAATLRCYHRANMVRSPWRP